MSHEANELTVGASADEGQLEMVEEVHSVLEPIDYEKDRSADLLNILGSVHERKIVVAGPGTGKSYLFQKAIEEEKRLGKSKFIAITFIGQLGDALADDLAGLSPVSTLHGFARSLVLKEYPDWCYIPDSRRLVSHDLELQGVSYESIADSAYLQRSQYYKIVGDEDVVYRAVELCKLDESKIPLYDLILVDEFQDFNQIESEFIDILATKNKILIVGDDDQALYEFKGASPQFIREKFSVENSDYESHVLKYCSRCTRVIVDTFHDFLEYFGLDNLSTERIPKQYISYLPDKERDGELNPKVHVMRNVPSGQIHIRIKNELESMLLEQKIKSVLVIGDGRTCKTLLNNVEYRLKEMGFRFVNQNVGHRTHILNQSMINGYKILNKNNLLAWRLIIECLEEVEKNQLIQDNYANPSSFISAIPHDLKKLSIKNAATLERILTKPRSNRDSILHCSIDKLISAVSQEEKSQKSVFMDQLIIENRHLARPLRNLDLTVCSIMGSKGLGADVVFLTGFDQGKLPAKSKVDSSEVYQMLVALTRAKKRIYLINTLGNDMSKFLDCIDVENYVVA